MSKFIKVTDRNNNSTKDVLINIDQIVYVARKPSVDDQEESRYEIRMSADDAVFWVDVSDIVRVEMEMTKA